MRKKLTLLDCIGLGINGIIGTGIFLLPARVYAEAGGLSWAAWLAVGCACLLVGLCVAEAAAGTDHNGGPYQFARAAFGDWVGTGVGWMSFVATLFAYSAVSRALGRNLAWLFPAFSSPAAQIALALGVLAALATLNIRGVRPGAIASDVFSGAKLVPLLLFVLVGLAFVSWGRFSVPAPTGAPPLRALGTAGLAGLFACTGFEYIPVPAGETDNPRRNVPLAVLAAVVGSTALYALIQVVFIGTHPSPSTAHAPLAEAAASFGGPWFGRLVGLGAVVSSIGFLTGIAVVAPRYLSALAADRQIPAAIGALHPRFGTPWVAIALTAVCASLFAIFGNFDRLSDLNNVAIFAQYVPTCLAIPVLRRRRPASTGFRLPFGPLVPVLGTLACLLFLSGIRARDGVFALGTLAVGLGLHALWRAVRAPARPEPAA